MPQGKNISEKFPSKKLSLNNDRSLAGNDKSLQTQFKQFNILYLFSDKHIKNQRSQ